jgi:hypothetical protein
MLTEPVQVQPTGPSEGTTDSHIHPSAYLPASPMAMRKPAVPHFRAEWIVATDEQNVAERAAAAVVAQKSTATAAAARKAERAVAVKAAATEKATATKAAVFWTRKAEVTRVVKAMETAVASPRRSEAPIVDDRDGERRDADESDESAQLLIGKDWFYQI